MAEIGRPLKFKNDKKLQEVIDLYFKETPKDEWTITGLAMALDTSRKVLCEYGHKNEFSNTIMKAKLKVENGYEIDLKKSGRVGTIFALKNFDWRDKNETDITTGGEMITGFNYVKDNSNNSAVTETTPSLGETP